MSMFFVKLKPAETYTHTHTSKLLLGLLSTIFVVSGALADPDIAPSASTADCKYAPLETYSGTSNLQANWNANTIDLHWYNGDTELTVPSASQSCTYDGTLTPPTTIPTKTGYTFKGWRVRQAGTSCFASQVCGLNGSAVNGLTYNMDDSTAYGYYSHDGQYKLNESTYGLTAGEWVAKDTSGGIVKGIVSCNSTTGSREYDSCEGDAIKPGNTFSSSSSGQYCWCKISSYTPSGGSVCNVASPSWVFRNNDGSASNCAYWCEARCAAYFVDQVGFRRAVFGVSQ